MTSSFLQKEDSSSLAVHQRVDTDSLSVKQLKNFSFHQLVSLLELGKPHLPPVGERLDPAKEFLRFRAARSLSFGAGDIWDIVQDEETGLMTIRVNFFGLYGPSSPLPPHFTERIITADETPSIEEDFLDLFNHALIGLLHQIWRKYRFHLRYRKGGLDPLSLRFLALCGFPIESESRATTLSRTALLPQIGLLSLYSRSADVVAAIVTSTFNIPCRIEEFTPRRVFLNDESHLRLGQACCQLGEDAILGHAVEDDLGRFTLVLGPADYPSLQRFLPDRPLHQKLTALIAMVNRAPLEWVIRFEFQAESLPQTTLGATQLGWSSWLLSSSFQCVENVVVILPQ